MVDRTFMMRDISLHLMDIIQNSVQAGARNITVALRTDPEKKYLFTSVTDDGRGMSKELLEKAESPFTTTRTTRNVGLGIPLFKLSGEIAGGSFRISSEEGLGTEISVSYRIDNINRLPLGDIGDTITASLLSHTGINYIVILDNSGDRIEISTAEIAGHLGDVPLTEYSVMNWIKEYINENVKNIFKGILEEAG